MTSTKIEWADHVWNPIVGCSIVSPGCTNCYAMKTAGRLSRMKAHPQYHGTVQPSRNGPVWTGKVALAEKALLKPLNRRKPTTYFVNSMGDLFHEDVPDDWIDQVFAVMALCPQHTFQVLTKRADRMREYITYDRRDQINAFGGTLVDWADMEDFVGWPLPNVWLGVSAEDQTRADERIYHLLQTPAAKRFVSAEPLLEEVSLINRDPIKLSTGNDAAPQHRFFVSFLRGWGAKGYALPGLDWVIVGGESGPHARPMHPDRALELEREAPGLEVSSMEVPEEIPGCRIRDKGRKDRAARPER